MTFDEWWDGQKTLRDVLPNDDDARLTARHGWEGRKPEIDALTASLAKMKEQRDRLSFLMEDAIGKMECELYDRNFVMLCHEAVADIESSRPRER